MIKEKENPNPKDLVFISTVNRLRKIVDSAKTLSHERYFESEFILGSVLTDLSSMLFDLDVFSHQNNIQLINPANIQKMSNVQIFDKSIVDSKSDDKKEKTTDMYT